MTLCISIVNRGISQGHGSDGFTDNLGGLMVSYAKLLLKECLTLNVQQNVLLLLSFGLVLASIVPVTRAWRSAREVVKRD